MSLPTPTTSNRAVVTGASSGIGMALATELARRGHSLIVVARSEGILRNLKTRLEAEYGVSVEVSPCDLGNPAERQPLLDELAGREISILCNNAGIATFGPVADLDPAYEKQQVQVNAVACHDLVLAVLPGMVQRRAGAILNVGSAAGNMPIPNNATYAATKAFLNTFSESLRGELKGTGVNVTLLAPGPVRTEEIAEEDKTFVDRLVPDRLWVDTEYTARVSLDALARNKMRIVPGPLSQAMSVAGNYTPRGLMAPIVGRFYAKLGEGQQGGA
ncbi:mycolate reductase [Dietzia sp. CH92]|uniref:mycolate reductase n=1 Tax=Dietzia sp. CH92 TaxID=3051823 RepID=UPI0028D4994D|nr:mycolate reductase [Dietzia sp. CH92]